MVLLAPAEQFNRRKTDHQPMPDLEEFMTTREAAKKLGFNVRTIPSMMKDKELDGMRFGRVWLVSRKSVDDYLKKTKGMSKNDPRRKQRK